MDVVRLCWPADAAQRAALRRRGVPRLLIVDVDAEPPDDIDVLEDWVRSDAEEIDRGARAFTLSLRATRLPPPPHFDDDGLLRYGRELVMLSPLETRVTAVLLERIGHVVATEALARAGWPGGAPAPNTVLVTMRRLRNRLRSVGLALTIVATRGWMLEDPARTAV